ncbi:MAG: 3-deoxy-D-manno-octulosonate 8-phosphate phosphatase, partial [Bacteroidetes bacterium]|nr:3-deoxy-D-manno-octulosonate 8-phosphate phosphatase [Bacteroidota bacterium]
MKNYKELLKDVTTFIFDYDGVMTQGDVIMLPSG